MAATAAAPAATPTTPATSKAKKERATKSHFYGPNGSKLTVVLRPRSDGFLVFVEHRTSAAAKTKPGMHVLHPSRELAQAAYDQLTKDAVEKGKWLASSGGGGGKRAVPKSDFDELPAAPPEVAEEGDDKGKAEKRPGPQPVAKKK